MLDMKWEWKNISKKLHIYSIYTYTVYNLYTHYIYIYNCVQFYYLTPFLHVGSFKSEESKHLRMVDHVASFTWQFDVVPGAL